MSVKLSQSTLEWANDLLDELFSLGFEETINPKMGYYRAQKLDDWCRANKKYIKTHGLKFYHGITKICIVDPLNNDWVIKINFIIPNESDFCNIEADNYKKACENGLQDYFAATYKISYPCKTTVCLQEQVKPKEDYIDSLFYNAASSEFYKEDYENEDDYFDDANYRVDDFTEEDRITAIYGFSPEISRLINFIYDNEICDLHAGNWGTNSQGDIVMIDYSGC